jgi:hypothetical protein
MPSAGFELAIPAIKQLYTYAFDGKARVIGHYIIRVFKIRRV